MAAALPPGGPHFTPGGSTALPPLHLQGDGPKLSLGAKKVFRYDDMEEGKSGGRSDPKQGGFVARTLSLPKRGQTQPKLWWVLECSFLTIIIALSGFLNILWFESNDMALARARKGSASILETYNGTCTAALRQLAENAEQRKSDLAAQLAVEFLRWPALVADLNADAMRPGVHLLTTENVTRNLRTMWPQIRDRFPLVTAIYVADARGTFAGYEWLSKEVSKSHLGAYRYGALYRPPDGGLNVSAEVCPEVCPPPSELQVGYLQWYTADSDTGDFGASYGATPFDARERRWYQMAAAAKGSVVWSPVYTSASGLNLSVTAARAYFEGGAAPRMVAGSDIALDFLSEFLQRISEGSTRTFIVDSSGKMIASSGGVREVLTEGADGKTQQLLWNETRSPMIVLPMTQLVKRHGSLMQLSGSGVLTDSSGAYLYGFSTKFYDHWANYTQEPLGLFGLDWIIVSVQPIESFMSSIMEKEALMRTARAEEEVDLDRAATKQRWIVMAICIVFTAFGAWAMALIARGVARPLKRISSEMQSVARLQFLEAENGSDDSDSQDMEHGKTAERATGTAMSMIREVAQIRDSFTYMSNGLRSFARYMDPHVVQILVQSKHQAQLGVAKANVTVFFSDIADFTAMAEKLSPEVFMQMLGRYLDSMSHVIMDHQGVVGEFIGDAIMAWWNAPMELGDGHTAIALQAAMAQQQRLAELREEWLAQGLPEVKVRMGLVRGTVLAGNIGSAQRMKYGLVGDSVNLASRLEGLCKTYGVDILIEEAAHKAPGVEEEFFCRPLDLVTVKGRQGATELFELVASKSQVAGTERADECRRFVEDFAEVQALYRAGAFVGALEAVRAYEELWPTDQPAKMMRARCEELVAHPPGDDWSPIAKLTAK